MKPKIFLIAQDVNIYPGDGKHPFARTGEVGFYHLKKVGADGLLLGHSEVKDEPEVVNKKWSAALEYGFFNNIVLIGDEWEDLPRGWDKSSQEEIKKMKEKFKNKFLTIIKKINREIIQKTVFSYEPGWGVRGSGKADVLPPQPPQIENMSLFMRELIKEKYNQKTSESIRIIYGGSSSPERAEEILPLENVDGLILGSAGKTTDWVQKIGQTIQKFIKEKSSIRKGVLALNWKAYEIEESYSDFLKIIENFDGDTIEIYLAPVATELKEVKMLLSKHET